MKKMLSAFMRFLARINKKAMFEDARKMGIALIVTGTIGLFVANDEVSVSDGLSVITIGFIMWIGALAYGRM